jgi:GTPase SAR1 family protein
LLTYDITREETFLNLMEWLKEIKMHAAEDVKVYLVGNKSEMDD